ncbi:DUF1963 domain-containing protein [Saccharibacillus endophyticus]|uniref:DUF1963 domain-containing protein n=1 Tax=Saccharibacillus endophyticus TaxID=2060666 RepID=A0ABQ1ZKW7_9BACL|nr:DUF1963 domain-containing protein [Saccharibacillus endophyticus]GGH70247.1 hypothetical protein GCM10007362_06170 [Saccharibacillus endophyticus]
MQILLNSSGLYLPEAQKRLIEIVEQANLERKAAIMAKTAPEHAAGNHHAFRTRELLEGLGFEVDFFDLAHVPAEQLKDYPIIYLNGGDPFAILAELKESGADRILRQLHHQGHLLIGHSAGAAVLGTTIEHARILSAGTEPVPEQDLSGLGLVKAIVLPHSNRYEEREPAIKLLEFASERPESLLKIEDDGFYVYEQPTPEQRLNPEFVLQKLADAGLVEYRTQIGKLLFPSLKMELKALKKADIVTGKSRVGGGADLPEGISWPEWDECPYTFIAQINLAELPQGHTLPLPANGLLSFFYASAAMYDDDAFHGDPTTCKVIYTPSSAFDELRRLDIPESLMQADPKVVLSPTSITFVPDLCVPESDSAYLKQLGLGWDGNTVDHERYWSTFLTNLSEPRLCHVPIHRLLGHPDQIQGDMQEQCAKMLQWRSFDSSISEEDQAKFDREASEWRLLLQIDSDDAPDSDWGDTGRIYFWIREADLRQSNFDHVICIMQST